MARLVLFTMALAFAGCASELPAPSSPGAASAPSSEPGCADADGDNVVDVCDACDGDAETWNGIADYDGCPDTSGLSHGFLADPRNRFSVPYVSLRFELGSEQVSDVEASRVRSELSGRDPFELEMRIVCIGQAGDAEPSADTLAEHRAEALCGLLRELGNRADLLSAMSVGSAPYLRDEPSADTVSPRAIAQVLQAGEYLVAEVVDGAVVLHPLAREDHYPPRVDGCGDDGRHEACASR